jgi:hypothetical protein
MALGRPVFLKFDGKTAFFTLQKTKNAKNAKKRSTMQKRQKAPAQSPNKRKKKEAKWFPP